MGQRAPPLLASDAARKALPPPPPPPPPPPRRRLCPARPAGEAAAYRGTHHVSGMHGPAVVGQAALFSHYLPDCRSRLHTGGRRRARCVPRVLQPCCHRVGPQPQQQAWQRESWWSVARRPTPAVRAHTNCTLWRFSRASLAKMLKHCPDFLPPLCRSYLQARLLCPPCSRAAAVHGLPQPASRGRAAEQPTLSLQPSPSPAPVPPSPPQYLADLRQRMEARGQRVPKRVGRIERDLQTLVAKVCPALAWRMRAARSI